MLIICGDTSCFLSLRFCVAFGFAFCCSSSLCVLVSPHAGWSRITAKHRLRQKKDVVSLCRCFKTSTTSKSGVESLFRLLTFHSKASSTSKSGVLTICGCVGHCMNITAATSILDVVALRLHAHGLIYNLDDGTAC